MTTAVKEVSLRRCSWTIMGIALFLAVNAEVAAAGERFDMQMMHDGHMREFIVSVPDQGPPPGGYPIVMMLHGSSGEGVIFYNVSGWKELGDRENFVTVFPSSLEWCLQDPDGSNKHRSTKWVCGDLIDEACPGQDFADDDGFLEAMIDSIKGRLPVNSNAVFLTGFSNGCVMSSRIAANRPQMFRALSGGGGNFNKLDSAAPGEPPPYWHCVGTLDDRFTAPFGVAEIPFNDSCLTYFRGVLNRWLGAYHLTQDYEKDSTEYLLTYTFRTSQPGFPPAFYRFSLVRGLDHRYANGSNHDVAYASMFWQFFRTAANVSTSVSDEHDASERDASERDASSSNVRISPHPMEGHVRITLDASSSGSYTVYDISGRPIVTGTFTDGVITLITGGWSAGLYSLHAAGSTIPLIKH